MVKSNRVKNVILTMTQEMKFALHEDGRRRLQQTICYMYVQDNHSRLIDVRTLIQSMVREFLIQEGLYIPTKSLATGAAPPSSANPSTVAAFMDRVGRGPSQEHPLFSWEHSVSHAWNVAVIRVLNQKFRTYVTEKGLPKLLRLLGPNMSTSIAASDINRALDGAGDIEILIQEKLEYQQGLLRRTQRRVHALQGHTASEVEDNLKYELKTSRTKARRQERKRNVRSLIYVILS